MVSLLSDILKMSKVKTRSELSSHLSLLIGKGKELPVSELPTVRDMLRLGLFLREQNVKDRRNYTDKELVKDMVTPLLHQWTKANPLCMPPVINQRRTTEPKLMRLWHKAVETSLGKGNLAKKNAFLHSHDTLFHISSCKCSINCVQKQIVLLLIGEKIIHTLTVVALVKRRYLF